jgi:hypothetical protein
MQGSFKPFNPEERALIMRMHKTGLRGIPLFKAFRSDPVFQGLVASRGGKGISNALTNARKGRSGWATKALAPAAPVKKMGRPPGRSDSKTRRTKLVKFVENGLQATPPRYQFNNCPHCGCPLHGAQEGLRTEQELRGAQ